MGGSFGSSLQFDSLQGFPHSSRYSFGPHSLTDIHSPSGTHSPFSFLANPLLQRHISVQTCMQNGGLFGSSYHSFQSGVLSLKYRPSPNASQATSLWNPSWAVSFFARVSTFITIFVWSAFINRYTLTIWNTFSILVSCKSFIAKTHISANLHAKWRIIGVILWQFPKWCFKLKNIDHLSDISLEVPNWNPSWAIGFFARISTFISKFIDSAIRSLLRLWQQKQHW